MDPAPGARSFQASGDAYDAFMGRYSRPLADLFADAADLEAGLQALDVGCGPGSPDRRPGPTASARGGVRLRPLTAVRP